MHNYKVADIQYNHKIKNTMTFMMLIEVIFIYFMTMAGMSNVELVETRIRQKILNWAVFVKFPFSKSNTKSYKTLKHEIGR